MLLTFFLYLKQYLYRSIQFSIAFSVSFFPRRKNVRRSGSLADLDTITADVLHSKRQIFFQKNSFQTVFILIFYDLLRTQKSFWVLWFRSKIPDSWFRIPDSGFHILARQYSAQSLWDSVRAHDMFFFVCSATLFYLQRSSLLFAAFLFFICSVPFFYICRGSLFCLQRFFFVCSVSFLFAAFLFCLQRFSFVCSVSFLFAAFLFCLQRFFFVCSVSLVGHRTDDVNKTRCFQWKLALSPVATAEF